MTQPKSTEDNTRPGTGRNFLSRGDRAAIPPLKAQLVFWSFMVVGLALDLWSKTAVFDWLQQKQVRTVSIIDGFLSLVREQNPGAAFGIAAGQSHLLIAISGFALVVILLVFLFTPREQKLVHVALGLFAAGVCGNLWDRIFNDGQVRDFIDIVYWPGKHWPAFNVADSMLCIAVALLIISGLLTGKSSQKHAPQHK